MAREHPAVRFERYCDDVIVHAASERHARRLRDVIARRLAECGLELNEQKTRIVYCKDSTRRGSYEHESQGQAGARCRRCRRSVSPTCPPNRTCPFLCIRLSTGHAVADS